jgi:DNA polymerase-3 subunit gamma/tau
MTHTALARKYRPTRFSDLVAQEHVAAGLRGAVEKQRVAHAYLLTGPRGVGKTTAARVLAMALNCERRAADDVPAGEPCGTCDSCRRIWSGAANLDVVEIDAASNRGVDDARDLRERAMYAASGPDRYKVYIIDEAHMLTREAWNALLKVLEEPPPRVVFVFATTEPHKIANTAAPVLSRVQRFDFRRISPEVIVERLRYVTTQEQVTAEDDALRLIARVAAGGMRDALSLLDQALAFGEGEVTAARIREAVGLVADETYGELLAIVAERQPEAVFPFVGRLVDAGVDLAEFANGLGDALRALMVRVLGGELPGTTDALRHAVEAHASRFSAGDVLRMLQLLQDAETGIRRSSNARLHVEALLLRYALLDRTVELQDVLAALGAGQAGAASDAPPGNPEGRTGRDRPRGGGAVLRDAAAPPPRATRAPEAPSASAKPAGSRKPRAGGGTPDDGELRVRWDEVVATVRAQRPMVAAALEHTSPVGIEGGTVVLQVTPSDVHAEGLERSRQVIEKALGSVFGAPLRVAYRAPTVAEGKDASAVEGRRMDAEADRNGRLKAYRSQDQALDVVADLLDLELLD